MVLTFARGSVGVLATAVAVAGLALPAQAGTAVPDEELGRVIAWGNAASEASRTIPAELEGQPVRDVAAGTNYTVAVTATGATHVFGTNPAVTVVPEALADSVITEVVAGANNVVALTDQGSVIAWGNAPVAGGPNDVPAGLTGVKDVGVGGTFAAAVRTDGTVVAWGQDTAGQVAGVAGLSDVKSLALGNTHGYALKNDGTVAAWGANTLNATTLPAAVTTPGNVKAVASRLLGGLALLADGSLVTWGSGAAVPASLTGKTVVAIDAIGSANLALDADGVVTVWGAGFAAEVNTPPAELAEADIASIVLAGQHAVALVTDVFALDVPSITGTPQVDQTLTGVAARFSGSPEVSQQWLADGVAIDGATGSSLTLTEAQEGKVITLTSTAFKNGSEVTSATSLPTAAVAGLPVLPPPPPTTSKSKTKISKVKAKRAKITALVTVNTTPKRAVSGSVKLVIKRGNKTVASTKLKVNSKGVASFSSKKLKPKVRKQLAKKGKYKMIASYSGAKHIKKSSGSVRFRIR